MRDDLFVISRAPDSLKASSVPQAYVNSDDQGEPAQNERTASGSLGLDVRRCRSFEDQVATALASRGYRVLLAPHVYHLSGAHPVIARLTETAGNLVVASWLYPRPAYWTLRAHGVEGESVEPSTEQASTAKRAGEGSACCGKENRTIHCYDLRTFDTVDACVDELLHSAGGPIQSGTAAVEDISEGATLRWYPVVDYSRCENCKQCLEFCLFGVYSLVEDTVVATQPDNCKPGCPACARVCPNSAIMFPHYAADAAIAGAPGAMVSGEPIDVDAFFRSQGAQAPTPESPAPCKCKEADRDDLDELIDALDGLDN